MTLAQRRYTVNASTSHKLGYLNVLLSKDEWNYAVKVSGNDCTWSSPACIPGNGNFSVDDEFLPSYLFREDRDSPGAELWKTVLDGLMLFSIPLGNVLSISGFYYLISSNVI